MFQYHILNLLRESFSDDIVQRILEDAIVLCGMNFKTDHPYYEMVVRKSHMNFLVRSSQLFCFNFFLATLFT